MSPEPKAVAIVWVSPKFSEGHRAALDWLNQRTDDEVGFFGVEVEAYRIGDSLPAPRFNVVSKPNEWAKTIRASAKSSSGSNAAQNVLYWQAFEETAPRAVHRPEARPVKGENYLLYPLPDLKTEVWVSGALIRSQNKIAAYARFQQE